MPRLKLELPEHFLFSTLIPVRITDLNYGGHVGNDSILSLLHEARVQFLRAFGYTELDLGGSALIMADVAIQFKGESFYGDVLQAKVTPADIHAHGFDLYYHISESSSSRPVAFARTAMLCFDYQTRKISRLPDEVKVAFETKAP